MTARKPVWALHESRAVELPEWEVYWWGPPVPVSARLLGETITGERREIRRARVRATHAWDAWSQVKGAPAFGSCRARMVV